MPLLFPFTRGAPRVCIERPFTFVVAVFKDNPRKSPYLQPAPCDIHTESELSPTQNCHGQGKSVPQLRPGCQTLQFLPSLLDQSLWEKLVSKAVLRRGLPWRESEVPIQQPTSLCDHMDKHSKSGPPRLGLSVPKSHTLWPLSGCVSVLIASCYKKLL